MYGVVITTRRVTDGENTAEEIFMGDWNSYSEAVKSLNTLPVEPLSVVIIRDIPAHRFVEEMGGAIASPEDIAFINREQRRANARGK